jgi:hypothetical protein
LARRPCGGKTCKQENGARASPSINRLGKPKRKDITSSSELKEALEEQARENGPMQRKFRLFVVEDLSSNVIELLGAHYDVEPAFFRDQIVDYAWFNTRDRWMDPPRLSVVARQQRWLQLRFPTSRYFENQLRFKEGCEQFESFNVYRRLEDDINNTGVWDADKAIVGLSRTRATFWIAKEKSHVEGAIGSCAHNSIHQILTVVRYFISGSDSSSRISSMARLPQLGRYSQHERSGKT